MRPARRGGRRQFTKLLRSASGHRRVRQTEISSCLQRRLFDFNCQRRLQRIDNVRNEGNFLLICSSRILLSSVLPSKVVQGQMSRRSRGRPSRAKLKRNTPSFTVEVRRQPRRASNSSTNGRLFETAPVRSAFDRDTQRAADAVFEVREPEQPLSDAASSAPKGRILPSLVVDDSAARSFREDSRSEYESADTPGPRRRSARLEKTAKPPKFRRQSASPTAETPSAESPGYGSAFEAAEAIFSSPSRPAATREIDGPAQRKAPKKRAKKPGFSSLAAWLNEPEPEMIEAAPPAPPSPVAEVAPTVRKRIIMGRYVFGDEPKPGERWKRPLRKTR
jgi:hypothetical protein